MGTEAIRAGLNWLHDTISVTWPMDEMKLAAWIGHEKAMRAELAVLEAENKEQAARIAELEAEADVHYQLIKLQQRRIHPAEELWRQATGSPDTTYPDLGDLIEFLLARIAELGKFAQYTTEWRRGERPFESILEKRAKSALVTAPGEMVPVERERLKEIKGLLDYLAELDDRDMDSATLVRDWLAAAIGEEVDDG